MKLIRHYTIAIFTLIGAYLLALFLIPPDASALTKYSLTPEQARLLSLTIAFPLIAIWMIALTGFRHIARYALKIRKHKEGPGFLLITKGIAVLVAGLPLASLTTNIMNYVARTNPNLAALTTIITNYTILSVILIGFYFVSRGTRSLLVVSHEKPQATPIVWKIAYGLFASLFVYLTFTNPARRHVVEGVQQAVYYLPDFFIATTIVIPYLITWYLGLTSSYQLFQYSKRIAGIIYKQAFNYIAMGMAFVIFSSILIRFLSRLNFFFNAAELKLLLGIIYLLLLFISVGYILIAIGAKKLKRIEDV